MNTEICAGQLYKVRLTGRSETDLAEMEFICVATSAENVTQRLPYMVDLGEYTSYRIDRIEKLPRAHMLRMRRLPIVLEPCSAVIRRAEGTEQIWSPALAVPASPRFRVTATMECRAKCADKAVQKLIDRVAENSNCVEIRAEEIGERSGYALPRDVSMYDRASFVRG